MEEDLISMCLEGTVFFIGNSTYILNNLLSLLLCLLIVVREKEREKRGKNSNASNLATKDLPLARK